jgi:hypothetical protein
LVTRVYSWFGQFFYTNRFADSGRFTRMKETVATFGFMLFFAGAMMDIAGSTFVTQGGTPAATYFRVGVIELIGPIIFLVGIYLIVKTR